MDAIFRILDENRSLTTAADAVGGMKERLFALLDEEPSLTRRQAKAAGVPLERKVWTEYRKEWRGDPTALAAKGIHIARATWVAYRDAWRQAQRRKKCDLCRERRELAERERDQAWEILSSKSTEDAGCRRALEEQLGSVLCTLRRRERGVIRLRFGLDGGGSRTLEEVAEELGVALGHVRKIEAEAFRKLRHPSLLETLRDFRDYYEAMGVAGHRDVGEAIPLPRRTPRRRRVFRRLFQEYGREPTWEEIDLNLSDEE